MGAKVPNESWKSLTELGKGKGSGCGAVSDEEKVPLADTDTAGKDKEKIYASGRPIRMGGGELSEKSRPRSAASGGYISGVSEVATGAPEKGPLGQKGTWNYECGMFTLRQVNAAWAAGMA